MFIIFLMGRLFARVDSGTLRAVFLRPVHTIDF